MIIKNPNINQSNNKIGNMYNGYFDMNLALSAEYQALRKTYMFRVKPFNFV